MVDCVIYERMGDVVGRPFMTVMVYGESGSVV
jgi:hypothetical protein